MRVLLVENDALIYEQLIESLQAAGYVVDVANDGKKGLYYALETPIDIAIIDLDLPEINGIDVIKNLREQRKDYPVLILTARNRRKNREEGLEAGANDYIDKPFHIEELLARMRALIRRTGSWSQSELSYGPIRLNISKQRIMVNEEEIATTAFEYKVIEHLLLHAFDVASEIDLTEGWHDDSDRVSNEADAFIRHLRMKLDPDGKIL